MNFVYPGYFDTLGIALLTGRDFRRDDVIGSAKVCIVNDAFAKKYFGTVNAVGHKIGMGIDPGTIVFNHLNQPRELVKAEAVTELFG